ncbi:MAG TPA: 2OG-Fe(II) oxygenase family protein [Candidatus Babeliales bacterium]|jgi:isopenicillin N synthase-like dioxygenase|nr:2OG-Fe(II) oxygenase family protein [Candidatus Babeliales bacterium]
MFQLLVTLFLLLNCYTKIQTTEILDLDIISYEDLLQANPKALQILHEALHTKGIVGIRNVPGYKETYEQFITATKTFNAFPETIKEQYQPNRAAGDTFLGYEIGKEKFQRANGEWVIDDLKTSYYALVPNSSQNKWPSEVNLQDPFETLGMIMAHTGKLVMHTIGLLTNIPEFDLTQNPCTGRMLYYRKSADNINPYWCGAHFDHSLFTAILPAVYFVNGEQISEPFEAGLFVRTSPENSFKKIVADDMNVMMFQVGEFGQLMSNDRIRATEHRVHKATGAIERYTVALFFNAPMDTPVYSSSTLTADVRYGTEKACTFRHWHEASFKRYVVQENE